MAEMETLAIPVRETLAKVLADVLDEHVGWQMHRYQMAIDLQAAGLAWFDSWLASVLADDATVEVVRAAIWPLSLDASPAVNAMCDEATVRALAALSAHLAAPGPAGDPSGEVGLGCVICGASIQPEDSGLCDPHKYDEQLRTREGTL